MAYLTNKEIEEKYTYEEVESIFRYQLLKYTIEDANFHIDEFCDWHDLTKEKEDKLRSYAAEMAERYLYKYQDCSLPENAVWEHLVEMYYEDKVDEEE